MFLEPFDFLWELRRKEGMETLDDTMFLVIIRTIIMLTEFLFFFQNAKDCLTQSEIPVAVFGKISQNFGSSMLFILVLYLGF